jgi:hypothetical protein
MESISIPLILLVAVVLSGTFARLSSIALPFPLPKLLWAPLSHPSPISVCSWEPRRSTDQKAGGDRSPASVGGFRAKREELYRLGRSRQIGNELVREIDLVEARAGMS